MNLQRIGQAYHSDMNGRPPKNVDGLKRWFKGLRDNRDPEVILRSPRDGQTFVIIYGEPLNAENRDSIIAYEKKGKDGKRYVLTLWQRVKTVTDQEFLASTFAGGHKPQASK